MQGDSNNDYYKIACNDMAYLQATLNTGLYNNIAVGCQQVAEKMLKSVAEVVCLNIGNLMNSHNLRAIYSEINRVEETFKLDKPSLAMLKDFYFDAKYPGDNFVVVDYETCAECLDILYDVIEQTNSFREHHGYITHTFLRLPLTKPIKQMNIF